MSFLTQRLANKYPKTNRIRFDPSSLGQRLLSPLAELLEQERFDLVQQLSEWDLLTDDLGYGDLRQVTLSESQYLIPTRTFGNPVYTYPTVTAVEDSTTYSLARAENLEEFFYPLPSRLKSGGTVSITNWQVGAQAQLEAVDRLTVVVQGSQKYDPPSFVQISGWDQNFNDVVEIIPIPDDGTYVTKNQWVWVEEVSYSGFDGTVSLTLGRKVPAYEEDVRRAVVTDQVEGPFRVRLNSSQLEIFTLLEQEGKVYRTGTVQDVDVEEVVASFALVDASSSSYTPIDFSLDPSGYRIWVLDSAGVVHLHDLALTPFTVPAAEPSDQYYMELRALSHRVALNAVSELFTWFRFVRGGVQRVTIRRRRPGQTADEYLQADKSSWSTTAYQFSGSPNESHLPEDSWQDFGFKVTFNEVGQWDFFCDVTLSTVEGTYTSQTSVMVDQLISLVDLSSGVTGADGLWFTADGRLVVSTSNSINYFDLRSDIYFPDPSRQRLILLHDYSSVDVV